MWGEIRDGRCTSVCEFDVEDEDQAFAHAEERARQSSSRLALTNRASDVVYRAVGSSRARDFDAVVAAYSDQFVFDDRRRLGGDPIEGSAALRAASERVREQYSHVEPRTLAVRGGRLLLASSRWSDDSGNETTYLHVIELDDDGRIAYDGRFDEEDFEGAYRELDRRYYAGEGAAFADAGAATTEVVIALNRADFDRAFGELSTPDMHVENRSRSAFPNRSAAELRASFVELNAMVASVRAWQSAMCWLSPTWYVARHEREAVGLDGEKYEWARLLVAEYRDRRLASLCDFDVDDEESAFAYAEERMRAASTSRLAVTNRSCDIVHATVRALSAHDVDATMACYSDRFVYGDHRRISGDPVRGGAELRSAFERIIKQYSRFELNVLAVRGDSLNLDWSRWSDDAGNETGYLHVFEIGDDGLICYEGRFDDDDFEGAYRELERRYYAGEGAAYAEAGMAIADYAITKNRGDFDTLFGALSSPELRIKSRSRSVFVDRSAAEYRASLEELFGLVGSVREWLSAMCWVSPSWFVAHLDREAVGREGEQYEWTRLVVGEVRDSRLASVCDFDLDDEAAAFAYAEERMRAAASRLAVANRASESVEGGWLAMRAHDVDGLVAVYSDRFEYDDRRRLSGDPIDSPAALRAAAARIVEQYPHFEWRTLAVRGERLELHWSRWWDDGGNETTYLHVCEIGEDARITYDSRFDEDAFEGAYRELERRYYAGEGAAFAEAGGVSTDRMTALNRGDFDALFGELTTPDMRFEMRSLNVFPDRSAAEFRAGLEELNAMVASVRNWSSAMCWLSPNCAVVRQQREADGLDGEQYEWTRLLVKEYRDGRLAWLCDFEVDDEESAFAYAEERIRATNGH